MGYYYGEQSLGLKPILIAVAVVTAALFGAAYYASGIHDGEKAAQSGVQSGVQSGAQSAVQSAAQSAAPSLSRADQGQESLSERGGQTRALSPSAKPAARTSPARSRSLKGRHDRV